MPKVSVIIPVYGVEKYIERCAISLFKQTLDDVEFIFVDDVTPDYSMEILNLMIDKFRLHFVEKKISVRIERMPTNSGLAAVRRHGVKLAKGDYIIHCDSDDWIDASMLQKMYCKAQLTNSDIVVCDYYISNGIGNNVHQKGCLNSDKNTFLKDMLYQKISWAVWNKMIRRKLYEKGIPYPENAVGEDMVFSTFLTLNAQKISYIQEPLYYYFYNQESIMRVVDKSSSIDKYIQLKHNTNLLISRLKDSEIDITRFIPSLKLNQCLFLNKFIVDDDVYHIWKSEMKSQWKLLFNRDVLFRYKIIYVAIITNIYPIVMKLKKL